MSVYSIQYGAKHIEFTLEYKERKYLKISVTPELEVKVSAPVKMKEKDVINKVEMKSAWILKHLEYFQKYHPKAPPKEYTSGETHRYLGKQFRLKVIQSDNTSVKLKRGYFHIYTSGKEKEKVKELLDGWYNEHAFAKFNLITNKWLDKLSKYGIEKPKMKMRRMKTRWGSCNYQKKSIMLNTYLIQYSTYTVEYIIVHELAHLKYPGHNKKFYTFLDIVMPDWRRRKKKLDQRI
ncbi:M48 family metallopeptidase [bacterium]|nr:M48 family metallopeptidase [bacterium]